MDYNFKYYGQIDVSNIDDLLLNTELNWDEYTFRQTNRKGQQHTKTIPLIWSEDFEKKIIWKSYKFFEIPLTQIRNILMNLIGDGEIITALLINLPKNKKILPHTDSGNEHFFKTKRLHIPIITNDKCNFMVGDETIQMKRGEIWEIDNSNKIHSVNNDGNIDRIHLLIDYQPTKKDLI